MKDDFEGLSSESENQPTMRELAAYRQAVIGLLEAMEMQEGRETGEFHISQPSARFIWDAAKKAALDLMAGKD